MCCLVLVVHFVTEGFCFAVHGGYEVAWFVMFKNIMKVSEKAENGRNIFATRVCKGAADKSKVAAENQSVAVKDIYSFVVEIHVFILE